MRPGSWNAVVMLALLLVVGIAGVVAQTTNSEMSGIVGTWRTQVTVQNCETGADLMTFSALFTFAHGGTLLQSITQLSPAGRTPGHGFWQTTGENTYHAVFESFIFDADGVWAQTQRITQAIEIGDISDEFINRITAEFFDTEGNLVMGGCSTAVGQRMK